jgi:hypothetical protein
LARRHLKISESIFAMVFPPDVNMDATVPTYFIYRDTPVGQTYDPAAQPVFFPPKDSDELFDALRTAFPHLKTHSERMREAMIKFLLEEQQAEQGILPSPLDQSWPSISPTGTFSTFSSPETLDMSTPAMSPAPQLTRQFSTAPSITTASAEPSPPALENMTGVFSVSTIGQPKQKIRRKMTEAEKVEYRKRRQVKACESCAKRKRKCTHNQTEMETLASKQKVSKQKSAPKVSAGAPRHDDALKGFENLMFDDMQLFDDFSYAIEEHGGEQQKDFDHLLSMDDFFINPPPYANQQNGWQFENQYDVFSPVSQAMDAPTSVGFQNTTGGNNMQTATSANNANANEALRFDQVARNADHTHGVYLRKSGALVSKYGQQAPQPDTGGEQVSSGNGMLWEHLRTGQSQPTHTLHAHDGEGHGAYVYDGAGRSGTASTSQARSPLSLASTVLQLTGTAKAVRAFGRCLKSNGSKSISLQLVTTSILASSWAQLVPDGGHQAGGAFVVKPARLEGHFSQNQHQVDMFGVVDRKLAAPRMQRNHVDLDTFVDPNMMASGPLEGMAIGDYLRMKTNFDDLDHQMGRGGQAIPGCIPNTAKQASSAGGQATASTSVPFARRSLIPESTSQQKGRPISTLGGDIERATSPSAELYMLKRRIPKSLHSIVDQDSNAVPTPLLQTRTEREPYQDISTSRDNGHNSQANGGAYLRLDSANNNQPILDAEKFTGDPLIDRWLSIAGSGGSRYCRLDVWANPGRAHHIEALVDAEEGYCAQSSDVSVHTRSRNPSASGNATGDKAGRQNHGVFVTAGHAVEGALDKREASSATETALARVQNGGKALQVTPSGMRQNGENSVDAAGVWVHRKRSTFRCKDHFGREDDMLLLQQQQGGHRGAAVWTTWNAVRPRQATALAVLGAALLVSQIAGMVTLSSAVIAHTLVFLFTGTRFWQVEPTHNDRDEDFDNYTTSDQRPSSRVTAGAFTRTGGLFPKFPQDDANSRPSQVRRRRRQRPAASTLSLWWTLWPRFLSAGVTVRARYGQWRRGGDGTEAVSSHGRFGRCGGAFPRYWGGLGVQL